MCNVCQETKPSWTVLYGCRTCDWDACYSCDGRQVNWPLGTRVKITWSQSTVWGSVGVITDIQATNTPYIVTFPGDTGQYQEEWLQETNKSERLRTGTKAAQIRFGPGDKVKCKYNNPDSDNNGKWYTATVDSVTDAGEYNITWEDGDGNDRTKDVEDTRSP